jgi:hypothetical protein
MAPHGKRYVIIAKIVPEGVSETLKITVNSKK